MIRISWLGIPTGKDKYKDWSESAKKSLARRSLVYAVLYALFAGALSFVAVDEFRSDGKFPWLDLALVSFFVVASCSCISRMRELSVR